MLKSSRNEPWAPFSGVLAALVAARPTLKGSNFVNFDFQALQKFDLPLGPRRGESFPHLKLVIRAAKFGWGAPPPVVAYIYIYVIYISVACAIPIHS